MSDRQAVRAGMEMLSWQVDADEWHETLTRRRAFLRRVPGTGHVDAESLVDKLAEKVPDQVLFTSTGVIAGEEVQRWRSGWWRLSHVSVISAGWDVLLLRFMHKWGITSRKMLIPLPPDARQHVLGMAEQLVDRTEYQKQVEVIVLDSKEALDIFSAGGSDDTVAKRTAWTPLVKGGSSGSTHQLVGLAPEPLEFVAGQGGVVLGMMGLIAGTGFAVVAATTATVGLVPVGLLLAGAGGWGVAKTVKRRVFDRLNGIYWTGYRSPFPLRDGLVRTASVIPFSHIHAVQLLSEVLKNDKQKFVSWELNLVLSDASRVNVVDHGDYTQLREDAERLAHYLGVPFWNAL